MKHDLTNRIRRIRLTAAVLLAVTVLAALIVPATAVNAYPKPTDYVADDAKVLSQSTVRSIKKTNETLAADVKAAIAVCTVPTTGDTDIEEYAGEVFREWKMGDGVLLLIAADDENYYFVPSVGVDKFLTSDELIAIRDEYLEEDFASGYIDRGVLKTVNRLSNLLLTGLKDSVSEGENTEETEEKGTSVGSVIVGFFKTVLIILLIAVLLVAALFVAALFNDDAMAIFQAIFIRQKKPSAMPEAYYDERLYGPAARSQQPYPSRQNPNAPYPNRPQQNPGQPVRRAPQGQPVPVQRQQNVRPQNTVRQPRQQNPNSYNANNYQNSAPVNGNETRAYTIPRDSFRNQ